MVELTKIRRKTGQYAVFEAIPVPFGRNLRGGALIVPALPYFLRFTVRMILSAAPG